MLQDHVQPRRSSPVQYHYTLDVRLLLHSANGNANIVEKAETHALVGLCMMTGRPYIRKGLVDFASGDGEADFNHSSA